jgi:hypothetical protein
MVIRMGQHAFWVLLAAAVGVIGSAQSSPTLSYQSRGRYSEGVRAAPSTGAVLDLVSAMVDPVEPHRELPPAFRAAFYLPADEHVHVTVREIDARYYYWLDKVQPSGWQAGKRNVFEWPTATVIRSLRWAGAPLALPDLGAVARVGTSTPSRVERVLPVALYHTRAPDRAESYSFVFRPGTRMRLRARVSKVGSKAILTDNPFPNVLADEPHLVPVDLRDAADGWYRLAITGYSASNNAEVSAEVQFYHAHNPGS